MKLQPGIWLSRQWSHELAMSGPLLQYAELALAQPMMDVPIYGRIATMEVLRPPGAAQDMLFLATERNKVCLLAYNPATGELETK